MYLEVYLRLHYDDKFLKHWREYYGLFTRIGKYFWLVDTWNLTVCCNA